MSQEMQTNLNIMPTGSLMRMRKALGAEWARVGKIAFQMPPSEEKTQYSSLSLSLARLSGMVEHSLLMRGAIR